MSFPEISYGNFRKPLYGWFTRKSLEWAAHLAPVDDSLRYSLYKYTPTIHPNQGYLSFVPNAQKNYSVIAIGYDPELFYCSTNKVPNSFITVAQMDRANYYRKGIDLMLALANHFPQCRFTLIGYNPNTPIENIPSNFILKEFVPYEKLREEYSTNEFYLQLSMMEGFPSAPCEAMLCECIPIVSSVAAMPHIVGNTGFVLMKKDIAQLVSLVDAALVCNKSTFRINARARIQQLFSKDTRIKLVELISSL